MKFTHRLSTRLIAPTAALLLLLAAAVAAASNLGLQATQQGAVMRSAEGLKNQGRQALLALAVREAQINNAQLQQAADLTRIAASYMESVNTTGIVMNWQEAQPQVVWSVSQLVRLPNGLLYDANPFRRSETTLPLTGEPDAEAEQQLRQSAVLDALFPQLLERSPDSIAIYYMSPQLLLRYYPVIGLPFILQDTGVGGGRSFLPIKDMPAAPVTNPDRHTVWGPPYYDNIGQGLMISAYSPVYVNEEYRGFVAVDISLVRMIDRLQKLRPSPGGYAFLVDEKGRLIATLVEALPRLFDEALSPEQYSLASTLGRPLTESKNPGLLLALEAMRRGQSDTLEFALRDQPVLLAYAPLPDLGWSLGLIAPISELTSQANIVAAEISKDSMRTQQTTLIIILSFALAALLGVLLVSRHLTRPISALVAGTQAVASGDLEVSLPVSSRDEMGLLASAFNKMTTELKKRNAELARAYVALRERERQYRSIFESTSDGMFIFDAEGRLVDFNPSACQMNGYSPDAFAQLNPDQFIHAEALPVFQELIERVKTGGQFRGRAVFLHRQNGPYPVEITGSVFMYRGKRHVLGVVRDITEQVRAYDVLEQRVRERTRELTTLLNASRMLATTLDLDSLLDLILDQLKDIVEYSGALIFTLEAGDEMVLLRERHDPPVSLARRRLKMDTLAELKKAEALKEAIIVTANGGLPYPDCPWSLVYECQGDASPLKVGSWMAAPLLLKERLLGFLALEHSQPGYYTTAHAALAEAFAVQSALAIENARLYEQAQNLAALEERQRLARELHDSVSQALYGIALGARTARTLLDRDIDSQQGASLVEPLDYVLSLAEAGLAEMRALIFELRPESLETEGLVAALSKQAAAVQARHGLQVVSAFCDEPRAPLSVKEAFYRIAQEAMNNVIKHARASQIDLTLRLEGNVLMMEIADNGLGFDAQATYPGHLGLKSMPERIERLGGSFRIQSASGEGTRIWTSYPLENENPAP